MDFTGKNTSGQTSPLDDIIEIIGDELRVNLPNKMYIEELVVETQTINNTSSIEVNDTKIKIGANNTSNTDDIGYYGQYNGNQHTGLIKDVSKGITYLIDNEPLEPSSSVANYTNLGNLEVFNFATHGNIAKRDKGSDLTIIAEGSNGIVLNGYDQTLASKKTQGYI